MMTEQEVTSRNAARLALKAAEQTDQLAKLRRLADMYFYDASTNGQQLAKRMITILDGLDA